MTAADAAALRAHVEQLGTVRVPGGIGDVVVTRIPRGIEINAFARTVSIDVEVLDQADSELLSFSIEPDANRELRAVLTIRASNGNLRYRVLGADGSPWDRIVCELIDEPGVGAIVDDLAPVHGMLERNVRRILVVAWNHRHFAQWCYEHDTSPRDLRLRHLTRISQLFGTHNQPYLVLDWPERFDVLPVREMQRQLHYCQAVRISEAAAALWLASGPRRILAAASPQPKD